MFLSTLYIFKIPSAFPLCFCLNKVNLFRYKGLKIALSAYPYASAILAITGDQRDDISQNEAFKKYGSGWITDRERRGLIHSTRQSSKQNSAIIYSRFEIETLKRTEKLIQEEYSRLANMSDK